MGGCNLGVFILFTSLDFPRAKKKRKKNLPISSPDTFLPLAFLDPEF